MLIDRCRLGSEQMSGSVSRDPRSWVLTVGLALILAMAGGCGGSKPAPIPRAPAPAPAAAPSVAPAIAPKQAADAGTAGQPAAATASGSSASGRPAGGGKAASKGPNMNDLMAIEEPENFLDVVAEGETMEVARQSNFLPTDGFQVTAAQPNITSAEFVLTEIPPHEFGVARENWSPPEGFTALPEFGFSAEGYPLRLRCSKDGGEMAFIAAGRSRLGASSGPKESTPEVVVELDAYYIDLWETTVRQFKVYEEDQKLRGKSAGVIMNSDDPPSYPALGATLTSAITYLRWAGKDMPSEAEFERAARGPQGLRTPWGDGRAIWPSDRPQKDIGPVCLYPQDRTPEGIFDLAGNAREWCFDWFSPRSHQEAAAAVKAQQRNWAGPRMLERNSRVVKGNGADWSAWNREGRDMTAKHPDVGFRGVVRLKPPKGAAVPSGT